MGSNKQIIDNLKGFIARFAKSHHKNNDSIKGFGIEEGLRGNPKSEEELETKDDNIDYTHRSYEHLDGILAINPNIDMKDAYEDEIDKPAPYVYGPPSWFIDKSIVNKPQPKVHGPNPDNR